MSIEASRPPRFESVRFEVETRIPTKQGRLRVRAYRDLANCTDHLALIADPVGRAPPCAASRR